jgi:hypothetical protein
VQPSLELHDHPLVAGFELIQCSFVILDTYLDQYLLSLISQFDFESSYNYYYVNVERCLPMEKGVSKSVNIIGQNTSSFAVDLYVFVSYGCSVNLNLFTGQRV